MCLSWHFQNCAKLHDKLFSIHVRSGVAKKMIGFSEPLCIIWVKNIFAGTAGCFVRPFGAEQYKLYNFSTVGSPDWIKMESILQSSDQWPYQQINHRQFRVFLRAKRAHIEPLISHNCHRKSSSRWSSWWQTSQARTPSPSPAGVHSAAKVHLWTVSATGCMYCSQWAMWCTVLYDTVQDIV